MACSLARRAARLAIFVLRRLGQRSGNRSPKRKTPPQAEASTIGCQAEGEADSTRGGRSTGEPSSVGVRRPRTDKHLLQLTNKAYPDYDGPATIFMGRNPNFTLGTRFTPVGRAAGNVGRLDGAIVAQGHLDEQLLGEIAGVV